MKYVRKYESFELNQEWQGEDDVDFIITKIQENFPKEDIKSKIDDDSDEMDKETALIDMICWFEREYKDISDEDVILDNLRQIYEIN